MLHGAAPALLSRRLLGCALAVLAASGWREQTGATTALSTADVERRLNQIPLVALVNAEDSPYFTASEGTAQVKDRLSHLARSPLVP